MHGAGVVQHAPGIDDIEGAQGAKVVAIEHRAPLDGPVAVARTMQVAKPLRATDRIRVVVEGMDASAEPARGQREQPAAGTDVDQARTRKGVAAEQVADRFLSLDDLIGAEIARKIEPVVAKPKTTIVDSRIQHRSAQR